MKLSHRDFDTLLEAMLALHEPRGLDELRSVLPKIVLGVIRGERFVWGEGDFGAPGESWSRIVLWESPPRMTPALTARLSELMGQHPFAVHGLQGGKWGPMKLSDFMSRRQLLASSLYRDVYRHVGLFHLLSCGTFRGKRIGTLSICRPMRDRDFTERDRLVLELLMPHFERALREAELVSARQVTATRPLSALGLTPREVDVAIWVGHGRTNGEIATILGMRPRTVEKHLENILAKLGVENRTAVALAIAASPTLHEAPPQMSRGKARRPQLRRVPAERRA